MSTLQDSKQTIAFFMPDQILVYLEHEKDDLNPAQIIESLQGTNWLSDNAKYDPETVISFPAAPDGGQTNSKPFSVVPVALDLGGDPDTLIKTVEELNANIPKESDLITVLQALPNWLSSGSPNTSGTGGPGATPIPDPGPGAVAIAAGTGYQFQFPTFPAVAPAAVTKPVEVIILDALPGDDASLLVTALAKWPNHPVLQSLVGNGAASLTIEDPDPASIALMSDPIVGCSVRGYDYKMTDHGLFVAGIVRTIAPQAELHLIRVLGDYGVGSLQTIIQGLQVALTRVMAADKHFIVNLSLTINLPTIEDFDCGFLNWPAFSEAIRQIETDRAYEQALLAPLNSVCLLLESNGVEIVAAAGNDWRTGSAQPAARFPAAFDSVLGVGSLKDTANPATYTDNADQPRSAGLMAFGGDASPTTFDLSSCTLQEGQADPNNGVLGLYIGEFPAALGSPANNSGWARWAGTSFAAAVVSGQIAARCAAIQDLTSAVNDLKGVSPARGTNEHILAVTQS